MNEREGVKRAVQSIRGGLSGLMLGQYRENKKKMDGWVDGEIKTLFRMFSVEAECQIQISLLSVGEKKNKQVLCCFEPNLILKTFWFHCSTCL